MTSARPDSLELEIAALYGAEVDWRRETGVVHVAAIGGRPRSALAIGPGSPASRTDRFVLGFARARADAIVTTSAILRAEAELVHRASDDPDEDAAWRRWRSEVLGRHRTPECVVVSQSGLLPLDHPALRGPGRPTIVTSAIGRERLAGAASRYEVVVVGDLAVDAAHAGGAIADARAVEDAGARTPASERGPERLLSRAIAWLQRVRGAETVVLETGPRSTVGLYAGGLADSGIARVDELLLSVFVGGPFEAVAGPELPGQAALACYFEGDPTNQPRSRCRRREASGPWDFERYRRSAKS